MQAAKTLKRPPRELAQAIIAAPGFINLRNIGVRPLPYSMDRLGTSGSGLYLIVWIGYAETWPVRSGWNSQVRCII